MKELESDVARRIECCIKRYSEFTGRKLTWAGLAKNIGYTPQAPTNWKKGKISYKVITQIADYLKADPAWLMYGSPHDMEIIDGPLGIGKSQLTNPHIHGFNPNFNAAEVDAIIKSRVDDYYARVGNNMFPDTVKLVKYIEKTNTNEEKVKDDKQNINNVSDKIKGAKFVPVISFVQAGTFKEAILGAQEDFVASYVENLSGEAFALEVKGDSMMPDFKPGDKIIVDPDVQPVPGDFVIAQNGEHEATFKKYRPRGYDSEGNVVFELTPLNPDYPILNSAEQSIRVIGTVVEHFRSLRKRST